MATKKPAKKVIAKSKPIAKKSAPAKKPVAKKAPVKKAAVKKPVVKKAAAKPVTKKPVAKAAAKNSSTKGAKPLAKSPAITTSTRTPANAMKKATHAIPMPAKKDTSKDTKSNAKPEPKKGKASAKDKASSAAGNSAVSDALEAKLLKLGKVRGILTYDDLNKYLPADEFSPEVIDDLIQRLDAKGVKVIELPDVDDKADSAPFVEGDDDDVQPTAGAAEGELVIDMEPEKAEESYGRSDDPVRMYLREMGNVELLSREGEIEIAKRIESGREMVISSLCESPTVMHMVLSWRDKLANSEMLLREVIDLDATYGAGTEDKFADAQRE